MKCDFMTCCERNGMINEIFSLRHTLVGWRYRICEAIRELTYSWGEKEEKKDRKRKSDRQT